MPLATKLPWELANPKWAATLNPILGNPLLLPNILHNIVLKAGDNIIDHGLQAKLQGYFVIMNSASATFFDKQPTNQTPNLTLVLNSSAPTTVSLYLF